MHNLLCPLTEGQFFEEYWLKKPFVSVQDEDIVPLFSDLIPLNEVEQLISSLSSTETGWLEIVKPNIRLDRRKYSNDSGFIDLSAAIQAYANGYTLVFSKVHKRIPKVADLVREYEKIFLRNNCFISSQVRATLVLTPKFSVGFPIHYDDHGIFIFQISGEKNWFIYDKIDPYPTTNGPIRLREEQQEKLKLLHTFNIKPGNWCYMPRGYYHNAEAHDHHSMHIAMAVKSFTVLDFLDRILELFPACRQPLPMGMLCADKEEYIKEGIIERVVDFSRDNIVREGIQNLREEQIRKMDILPEDSFSSVNDLESINLSTAISLKRGTILELKNDKLLCSGISSYMISDKYKKVISFIQENRFFKISELPNMLAESEKISFVRQLVLDGILTISNFNKLQNLT